MPKIKVSIQGLSKTYITKDRKRVEALRDLSFEVFEGEFLCIVGPNGCGKTTLLRTIAGLEEPTGGRILIDGRASPGVRRVGFVFQEFSLFPWRTVIDNVKLGLEIQGVSEEEAVKASRKYVKLAGLSEFEGAYPNELSSGMKQMVAISRALATNPSVLLMDEPFAALDAQTRNLMQTELLEIWEEERKTVVFVTHSVDEAVYLADRIVLLTARPGRVRKIFENVNPRPRERTGEGFIELRGEILSLLEEEIKEVSPF